MVKVDIVITWVNGNDPEWRKKRAQYHPSKEHGISTGNVEGRYRCNEELRFLLRSIEQYWTLPGRIYLVTDQQVPHFIRNHPHVSIVDHRDIMDAAHLPVFSSMAIEANLHRIPGLAEHFVAFNDDIFLTRPVGYEDFFGDRGAVVYLTDEALPAQASVENFSGFNSAVNARNWIMNRYGHSFIDHAIEHSPKGIRVSWMKELEAEDPLAFKSTSSERFREAGTQSILANLYGHWCLAKGRGSIKHNECTYLLSDEIEFNPTLESLSALVKDKLCLCINDTTDNRKDVALLQAKMSRMLHELFPHPSAYEKPDEDSVYSITDRIGFRSAQAWANAVSKNIRKIFTPLPSGPAAS